MSAKELGTSAKNTWCPGCGNFAILNSVKTVLKSIQDDGTPIENVVLVSGIGCHAKIVDYINANSFYSIHGRATPVAEGIKLAGPELKVIGFAGDGDAYGEGIEHLVFAAKRNIDITMIIHNNRVYGLTTGQYTPTSPMGFMGRSTPKGTLEYPINPLELMLASGATFLARGFSHGLEQLKEIFKAAINHKGFSLVDILQVCVTFYNMYEYYDKRVYELKEHDPSNYSLALNKIREWNYHDEAPIALGVFYKKEKETFDGKFISAKKDINLDINANIDKVLADAS
ncbi:MAG: 2-oxoglutarate synthase [Candidatus Omnitrophica bacterium CG11_big_fil_rev_8_21_14_0_20_42_13]|uniref:2-oxoglutarate synthase n=1 Tax=Candidatus Ghiorseimicrobium undicola TaxID=1974746 RepID=A0A2H0LZ95_9BACT|nr:MAG: 2-oxoglutarate synthase [Candidatus Omnitrophica bacterium CG11_big_fil_rev_8_21_14_0_20_42_13]